MRRIKRSALVPYSPQQMFDIVNDVARYGEYLPWCESGLVVSETDCEMVATIQMKAPGIRQSFTTRNVLDEPNQIRMKQIEGMFSSLQGEWNFKALGEDGSKVSLDMTFDMSRTLAMMGAGVMFDSAADKMVEVFCNRAAQLYG